MEENLSPRYVIRYKPDGTYYQAHRRGRMDKKWVKDINLATVLYSDAVTQKLLDERFYEKIFINFTEIKSEGANKDYTYSN